MLYGPLSMQLFTFPSLTCDYSFAILHSEVKNLIHIEGGLGA